MFRTALLFCVVVSAGLLSGPADARERHKRQHEDQDRKEQQQQQQETLRPDGLRAGRHGDGSAAAARAAQQRNGGGRVLSVDPDGSGYRVKVLKDGEVRTHHVEDQ